MHSRVVEVATFDLQVLSSGWPFAKDNAGEIDRHWQKRIADNPAFFDGTVHLLKSFELTETHFSGRLIPVKFSSFLYWRDNEFPDKSVRDCFGSALVRSRDGAIILGRQAPGNINAGKTYLPGGFIDERDVGSDGRIDLAASVARELREELGFDHTAFVRPPTLHLTFEGQLVSMAMTFVSPDDAATLLARGRAHIAREATPELEDLVAVRAMHDVTGLAMPGYSRLLLQHLLPA